MSANSSGTPTITVGTIKTGDSAPTWTHSFNSRNASTAGGATLTPSGLVSDGNSGNNYSFTFATAAGTINKTPLTVTAATNSKMYDGTTSAAATPTITLGAIQTGDAANFTESVRRQECRHGQQDRDSVGVGNGRQ